MKLEVKFEVDLGLETMYSGSACMTQLIPFARDRAIGFGWGIHSHNCLGRDEEYWFADITSDGVSKRVIPIELTHRLNQLAERSTVDGRKQIRAFRFGEGIGLLVGTQEVYLFSGIHDEPRLIEVENPFTFFGTAKYPTSKTDSHYLPERCGHASAGVVPVIISSPQDRPGQGRHACLLSIDVDTGRARWLVDNGGLPRSTRIADYEPFIDPAVVAGINTSGSGGPRVQSPLLWDCAWIDSQWHLFVAGFWKPYSRFGASPALLTRNHSDMSLLSKSFQAGEDSLGRICASHDRVIITPLRKSGPKKGKQTIYTYADGQEHSVSLPRGYAKHQIEEYGNETYWLLRMPLGYDNSQVVACR